MPKSPIATSVSCPFCGHSSSNVKHTYRECVNQDGHDIHTIRRRRVCNSPECKLPFMTREIAETEAPRPNRFLNLSNPSTCPVA